MCGIIGYIGMGNAKDILLNGLGELEYRGYDSAGIAILEGGPEDLLESKRGSMSETHESTECDSVSQSSSRDFHSTTSVAQSSHTHQKGVIQTFKAVGKLKNLREKCSDFNTPIGNFYLGIGHTRWATHGKPTFENAHPHNTPHASIVHNGIIENYKELKDVLLKAGHSFASETDSEVIVQLFEYFYNKMAGCNKDKDSRSDNAAKVASAFKKTIDAIEGSYAVLLMSTYDTHAIYYAKNGSPLILGRGDDGSIYIASSDAPLASHAKEVVYLEDLSVGRVSADEFRHLKGIVPLDITKVATAKEGYRYYMEKEIYEQVDVLADVLRGRIEDDKIVFSEIPGGLFDGIKDITICACGTSYHAGLVGKYLIERLSRIRVNVVIASEYRYIDPIVDKSTLFIPISQSGETADTLGALKLVNGMGIKSLAICNVDNSQIVRLSDATILTRAGVEKGVASTKAFSAQVTILWMLAIFLAERKLGTSKTHLAIERKIDLTAGTKTDSTIERELDSTSSKPFSSKEQIEQIYASIRATKNALKMHDKIKKLSKRYLHGHGFFYIGRDVFYPLALEGALKLKEISYLHAEGYPSGEMKHGPIALADEQLFTIAFLPRHLLFDKALSNVAELSARDATICAISQVDIEYADDMIALEPLGSYMEEFYASNIIAQLLALEIAVRLGNDVDMPRNLAKSVTVE